MSEYNEELCKYIRDTYDKLISQHSDNINKLTECTIKLEQIISSREEKNKDFEKRIKRLENKPVKLLDVIVTTIITALITYLITR